MVRLTLIKYVSPMVSLTFGILTNKKFYFFKKVKLNFFIYNMI